MNPQAPPSTSPHSLNLNNYKFAKERSPLPNPRPTTSPHQPTSPYSLPKHSASNPLPFSLMQGANPMSIKPLGAQGDDNRVPLRDISNEQANFHSPKDKKQKKMKMSTPFTEDLHKARSVFDFPPRDQDERPFVSEMNSRPPMAPQNPNDTIFTSHKSRPLTPANNPAQVKPEKYDFVTLLDKKLQLSATNDYATANEKLKPPNNEVQDQRYSHSGLFPFMEDTAARGGNNNETNNTHRDREANVQNYQPAENVTRTQDLLENFYSTLNQLPNEAQERTQSSRLPEVWNLGHNETLNFFRKLPFSEMVPEEYLNEAHQIQPQEMDLPNDIIEEFKRNVENATLKLHEGLKEINELFIFSQKTEKLCGDKENEMIHRNKEISNAFSNLSHYIWDYLQNQFNFNEGNFSQESSLNFQDVREKITSQKFLSELNDDLALDDLLRYFNRLMEEENDGNQDLRRNLKELMEYEVLDEELARYLFGEHFDCEAELEEGKLVVEEPNPVEEEFKNQYLTISQDLIQMSDNNKMEEEKINMNSNSKSMSSKTHKYESTAMNEEQKSGEKSKMQVMSSNMMQNPVTQMTESGAHFSEVNTYQQQFMEFDEGFMPVEFEEESNYMTGFPFMGGEEFELGGFDNENENESK